MDEHKLITGDKFVAELMRLGIIDDKTRKVTIEAEVGEVICLTIEKFGDDRLLTLVENGGIMIAHRRDEAICR